MGHKPIGIALLENRLAKTEEIRRKQIEQAQEARRRPRLAYIYSGFLGCWKKHIPEA